MGFSTTINVPSRDADLLMRTLADHGFLVLDTGARVTTDEGVNGEATLQVSYVRTASAN